MAIALQAGGMFVMLALDLAKLAEALVGTLADRELVGALVEA